MLFNRSFVCWYFLSLSIILNSVCVYEFLKIVDVFDFLYVFRLYLIRFWLRYTWLNCFLYILFCLFGLILILFFVSIMGSIWFFYFNSQFGKFLSLIVVDLYGCIWFDFCWYVGLVIMLRLWWIRFVVCILWIVFMILCFVNGFDAQGFKLRFSRIFERLEDFRASEVPASGP